MGKHRYQKIKEKLLVHNKGKRAKIELKELGNIVNGENKNVVKAVRELVDEKYLKLISGLNSMADTLNKKYKIVYEDNSGIEYEENEELMDVPNGHLYFTINIDVYTQN